MSAARLNVWVTRVGDPCRIDLEHQWFVHVLHCEGDILEWPQGHRFINLPTKSGHLEVEIPPGCYFVCATWSPARPDQLRPTSLGNHITHISVIRANCGDHVCVTLFPPTLHWCGIWWLIALREAVELGHVQTEAAPRAIEAVEALLQEIPRDDLTERMLRIAEERPEKGEASV
jgi:hypothetical protein